MTTEFIKRAIAPGLAGTEVRAIQNYAQDAGDAEALKAARDLVRRRKPITSQTLQNWEEVGRSLTDDGWARP